MGSTTLPSSYCPQQCGDNGAGVWGWFVHEPTECQTCVAHALAHISGTHDLPLQPLAEIAADTYQWATYDLRCRGGRSHATMHCSKVRLFKCWDVWRLWREWMSPLETDVSKMGPLHPTSAASLKWVPVRAMLLAKTIYLSVDGTGGVASNGNRRLVI